MQRIFSRAVLERVSISNRRRLSRLAHSGTAVQENGVVHPEMPPFDYAPPPYAGPSASEILQKRQQYLSPSIFDFYKNHLNIVDGKKQYLFDEAGRRYVDAFRGIATVCCDHCHPDVVEAIDNQTTRLQHSTALYLNPAITDFAETLASKLPGDLKVVFFTNSGTEANELALMIARLYTGCQDIISLKNGYHGNAAATMSSTAQCNYKFNVVQSGVHHALNPDQYRGVFGSDGEKYANDVEDLITYGTYGRVGGFIAEAIQGVGGTLELAPGYLPAVYSIVRKAGGVCIADEVQSEFGRIGSHFWGFEAHGVVPDIVTMAKGIGNGIPLGAVVTTPEIAKVLTYRNCFNTFGENPLCTAGGYFGNVFGITPPLCFTKDDADGYVYDLYAAKKDDDIDPTHQDDSKPYIVTLDDDFYDGPDEPDYETDDPDAESNPLNDYPEEESSEDESDASDNDDDDGGDDGDGGDDDGGDDGDGGDDDGSDDGGDDGGDESEKHDSADSNYGDYDYDLLP